MQQTVILIGIAAMVIVVAAGLATVPLVFAQRVMPLVSIGPVSLMGVSQDDLPGVLAMYEEQLQHQLVTLTVRDQTIERSLGQLGVRLNHQATEQNVESLLWPAVLASQRHVRPIVTADSSVLQAEVRAAVGSVIKSPRNATLQFDSRDQLVMVSAEPGEGIDELTFAQEISGRAKTHAWQQPLAVNVISTPPAVQDYEVEAAHNYALTLLRDGLHLQFSQQTWTMKPFTIRRLLEFVEAVDPHETSNRILAAHLQAEGLREYLMTTIAPEINQEPQNARFERGENGRVAQFAVAAQGQTLDLTHTVANITTHVAAQQISVPLAVSVVQPTVSTAADIEALGIGTLLARGETDFVGSPRNRVHNITVGTARYHGLLIPPAAEFSFNEYLGPVDGLHGFKPELVIKKNVTTPEFGGGLCQVSTTAFRAAIYAGMEITARRNHAYAVSYYGTPGFDATIYPPYTDLRFTNNTPGYILIQARVEGTKVAFDFWGTQDNRTVEVVGPNPYDRQPNGAVKATLTQKVIRDGSAIIDETFYSRYKSPELFPKVLAADAPQPG
ncbi:MAG: VanW family protein [Candidatus Andersenbacteria bacterium]